MPPASNSPALHLQVLSAPFFVIQLASGDTLPSWLMEEMSGNTTRFFSVTKTNDEISVVGESWEEMPDDIRANTTWKCIKILGPMEHNLTGIMADFTAPLKLAKVPVFAISTWNTDYVLVPQEKVVEAQGTLEKDGWTFVKV